MEPQLLYEGGNYLTSPVLVDDKLYVISNNTGEILEINLSNPKTATIWANSGGQPTGSAYDPSGGFYVTDFAHKALLYLDPKGENRRVCSECEGRQFIGPSSVARSKSGNLVFTDSGPAGATSVINPSGAIYQLAWSMNNFILVPIIDKGLACPYGIAFSKTEKYIYVCEFLANRILRLVEDPPSVYQPSVFYTFNGRMGPRSICVSHLKNYLFVGHFDYPSEETKNGLISIISSDGDLVEQISVPEPDITGLCLNYDEKVLYITVGSENKVYSCDVSLVTY